MRTLLRTLLVTVLLLSAGALALGIKLFNQREILTARIQRLEAHVIATAPFIESADAEVREQPSFALLDGISEDYGEEDYSFWREYVKAGGAGLEATHAPAFRVDTDQLRTLYRPDPIEPDKPFTDAEGRKIMEGEDTMDELLDDLQAKTRTQLDRFNDTRIWLSEMREELDGTIKRHNTVMIQRDERRAEVTGLEQKRAQLESDLRDTEQGLAEARETIDSVETEIRDQRDEYADLRNEHDVLQLRFDALDRRHKTLSIECGKPGVGPVNVPLDKLEPGQKGRIAYHDRENHFVIMHLLPNAKLAEGVELTCVREHADDNATPTGRLRLREILADSGKAVASVMNDWEIQEDDRVIF